MRVFFVNHSVAPVSMGGAERSLLTLVDDWLEINPAVEPYFVTKAPRGRFIEELESRGWPYLALRYQGWALPESSMRPAISAEFAIRDYNATKRIIEEMRTQRPSLVITNTLVAPWGAFAAATLGIPHAWFVREYGDLDHHLHFSTGAKETFEDISFFSDAIFVNSSTLRDYIIDYTGRSDTEICYPSLDVQAILTQSTEGEQSHSTSERQERVLRVIQVGRISRGKGQETAIRAIARVAPKGSSVKLTIVGSADESSYADELKNLARDLGVSDNVEFHGHDDNPFRLVRQADICITASTNEAFGRTTLEYMVLGKPVIAAARGGSMELIEHGVSGMLFEPNSEEDLARCISSYLRQPDLIVEHGNSARTRSLMFTGGSSGNHNAIEILESLASVGRRKAKLPHIANKWFELPSLVHDNRNDAGSGTALDSRVRGTRFLLTGLVRRSPLLARWARRVRKLTRRS